MKKVVIIIPCYNEEESLPQLYSELEKLNTTLTINYQLRYLFIDDGSIDSTPSLLKEFCEKSERSNFIVHDNNLNLGAAIKTGLSQLKDEDYVAFLDSDCTYDPLVMIELLAKLDEGADLATVSPYHCDGKVIGVPKWRLILSQGLSKIYRILLQSNLYTYTAMVRAVRRDIIESIQSDRDDFSYFSEQMIKSITCGHRVVEVPTTLKTRAFGVSKMKVMSTIKSHLKIIMGIVIGRYS